MLHSAIGTRAGSRAPGTIGRVAPLVLLDLDGTLTDSAPGILPAVAHAYRSLGLAVPPDDVLRGFIGPPITTSFGAHGVPPGRMDAAVAAYRAAYEAHGMSAAEVYPGIPDALRRLRAAGCRLVVATSKPEVYATRVCAGNGLAGLVDGLHGATLDESRSTKGLVVAAALRSAGPDVDAARTLMVGDREHDVRGAAEHGLRCLGVTWGYGGADELCRAGAVALVDAVAALPDAVLALLDPVAAG